MEMAAAEEMAHHEDADIVVAMDMSQALMRFCCVLPNGFVLLAGRTIPRSSRSTNARRRTECRFLGAITNGTCWCDSKLHMDDSVQNLQGAAHEKLRQFVNDPQVTVFSVSKVALTLLSLRGLSVLAGTRRWRRRDARAGATSAVYI